MKTMKKYLYALIAIMFLPLGMMAQSGTVNSGWLNVGENGPNEGYEADEDGAYTYYWNPSSGLAANSANALFSITFGGNAQKGGSYWGEENSGMMTVTATSLNPFLKITKFATYDSASGGHGTDHDISANANVSGGTVTLYTGQYPSGSVTTDKEAAQSIVWSSTTSAATNVTITMDDAQRVHYVYIEYVLRDIVGSEVTWTAAGSPSTWTIGADKNITASYTYNSSGVFPLNNTSVRDNVLNRNMIQMGDVNIKTTRSGSNEVINGIVAQKKPGTYTTVVSVLSQANSTVPYGGYAYYNTRTITWELTKSINHSDISVSIDPPLTYNGTKQKPTVVIYDQATSDTLQEGVDYTVAYSNPEYADGFTDAKVYVDEVIITGKGGYVGSRKASFTLAQRNLSDFIVTATAPYVAAGYGASNAESGAAVKAATTIVIKDGNGTVWTNYEGFEVTIDNDPTAANNYNNTGTYTGVVHVAVKADYADNFTGAVPAGDLTIGTGTDIISSLVVNTIDAMYTAGKLPPSENTLEVKLGSQVLTYGTDFDIIVNGEESDYVDAKTYHNAVIIKGKGAYYGSFIADYTIRPRSLGDEYIEVKATNLDYTGYDQDVTVVVKYKKNDVENVIPEDNYTFTPTTANEAGKYVITVNAVDNSNLLGSTTTDLWVFKSMETYADDFIVEPDPIPTQTATGSEIKPEVVVKDNNRTLVFGEDYNVTYSHNIDPGEATITITGMYAYSGTITRHFTIVPEYFVVDEITYHHALAGEEVTVGKKGDDGNVLATTLTGDVTVPATIHYSDKDFTVVGIEENAFSGDAIYTLTLPESIETIANKSFSNCSNLRWLDLTAMVGYTPSTLDRISDRGPFSKVPKQTLVFLEGTTTSGENYIYKYGDNDFRCDVLKIYEDLKGDQTGYNQANGYKWGFLNPYEFKANTVTNTRQLNATNTENKQQGYTICLPYALPVPNGVSAYTLMASKNDLLGFEPVDGNTLAALTPYVLIPGATGQLLSTTDATIVKTTDADLAATAVRSAAADGQKTYTMYGSMTYMDDVTGAYIMQSGNVWKQIETAGSYDGATNKACILPMRAYIKPDSSPAPVLYSVFGASGTTGMDIFRHISLDAEDGQLYDLQGRPVTTPTRGVYVRNGKKVVIK